MSHKGTKVGVNECTLGQNSNLLTLHDLVNSQQQCGVMRNCHMTVQRSRPSRLTADTARPRKNPRVECRSLVRVRVRTGKLHCHVTVPRSNLLTLHDLVNSKQQCGVRLGLGFEAPKVDLGCQNC